MIKVTKSFEAEGDGFATFGSALDAAMRAVNAVEQENGTVYRLVVDRIYSSGDLVNDTFEYSVYGA